MITRKQMEHSNSIRLEFSYIDNASSPFFYIIFFNVAIPMWWILSLFVSWHIYPFIKWCADIITHKSCNFSIFRCYSSVLLFASSYSFSRLAPSTASCLYNLVIVEGTMLCSNGNYIAMDIYHRKATLNSPWCISLPNHLGRTTQPSQSWLLCIRSNFQDQRSSTWSIGKDQFQNGNAWFRTLSSRSVSKIE